ncbi:MAG: hypothetical protein J6Y78_08880, partial [Paludibacteraceae bacterium]|nr:hypothetical protein [Paludibacteraceae bacterium]
KEKEEKERRDEETRRITQGIIDDEAGDNTRIATLLKNLQGQSVYGASAIIKENSEFAFGRQLSDTEISSLIDRIDARQPEFFRDLNNFEKQAIYTKTDVAAAYARMGANVTSNLLLSTKEDAGKNITVQAITPPLYSGSAFNSWRIN